MNTAQPPSVEAGRSQLRQFRAKGCPDQIFKYPTCHPSHPTGFCPCDEHGGRAAWFYIKAALLNLVLALPINGLSLWTLRKLGAAIGSNVYISAGAWIDPMFPDLLTIEDDVLIGVGARIGFHEFRVSEFVAGRVTLGKGCLIGGFSLIGPGVHIGEGATIAGGAVVARDVPAHSIAGGNPARVVSA
jgi:acetyltransferase-like isoleucine patch superfamily enzyme